MKLQEMIELMQKFGFEPEHVRRALAQGDSVHNAWEGLKIVLEIRWNEMNQTEGVDRLKELRPVYDRLQGLTLKSATKASDVEKKKAENAAKSAFRIQDWLDVRKTENLAQFTRTYRDVIEKKLEKEPDNEILRDQLARLDRGERPF